MNIKTSKMPWRLIEEKRLAKVNKRKYRKVSSKKLSSHTASEEFDILGDKAKIMRVPASGKIWQFRMWISEEGKYIRQSLKTRDCKTAMELAEKKVFETLGDIHSGKKIFSIKLSELVEQYLDSRRIDVEQNRITLGRMNAMKSQLKHFINFKSPDFKLGELAKNSLYDYEAWRKTERPSTQAITIRNEQSTINHMMKFAFKEGYSKYNSFEFCPITIKGKDQLRRDIFTMDEYRNLVRFLRTYCSKQECPDELVRMERLLIRDAILIAANTMLRVGEFQQLKWGDIAGYEDRNSQNGTLLRLVTINVRKETSKVQRDRTVVARGGEYFERLMERSTFTNDDDLVFTSIRGKSKFPRYKWHENWKNLMYGIGLDYKKRNLTYYSLRHFGITCRIAAEVPIATLADNAGTSLAMIEKHYLHTNIPMLRITAIKDIPADQYGVNSEDTETNGSGSDIR